MKCGKEKFKLITIICIFYCFLFLLEPNYMLDSDNFYSNLENHSNSILPKSSGYWSYYSIYIKDDGPGGNGSWAWAESQPWCSGSGNWSHPYIIENITINAQNQFNPLIIEDSNVYFIIRNCTIFNLNYDVETYAGIKLSKVSNGTLINNTCINNDCKGILLSECSPRLSGNGSASSQIRNRFSCAHN